MPSIVQATVKYPANRDFDSDYHDGNSTNAVFTLSSGEEVKLWYDDDTQGYQALWNLEKGDQYQLIRREKKKGDGYKYDLQDDDIQNLTGGQPQPNGSANGNPNGAPQGTPQNGAPHPAGGNPPQGQPNGQPQGVAQEPDPQELAKEHARLIANTYAFLDKKFHNQKAHVNQMPTPAEIQKMAVSAAIEAVR